MPSQSSTNGQRPHGHPGLFLALEGPDGGGKSTQAASLVEWLRGQGMDVVACHDPGSTAVGDRLRAIVLDRELSHVSMRCEMLIYMASRAQLVEEVIRPALAAGRVVVSDRFLLSNIVYQGFAGDLPVGDLWRVGQVATDGLLPDLTLVLDVPHAVARGRLGSGRDRIEDRPETYQARVREGFLDAARRDESCPYYPAPMVVIDASSDAKVVFRQLQNEVARVLEIGPRP